MYSDPLITTGYDSCQSNKESGHPPDERQEKNVYPRLPRQTDQGKGRGAHDGPAEDIER